MISFELSDLEMKRYKRIIDSFKEQDNVLIYGGKYKSASYEFLFKPWEMGVNVTVIRVETLSRKRQQFDISDDGEDDDGEIPKTNFEFYL